jgi:hypothetical protein
LPLAASERMRAHWNQCVSISKLVAASVPANGALPVTARLQFLDNCQFGTGTFRP